MNIEISIECVIAALAVFGIVIALAVSWLVNKRDRRDINMLWFAEAIRRQVTLGVKRLDPSAVLPSYAHAKDSGMDVATIDEVIIAPHSFAKLRTGIACVIPVGYEIQVRPRSGLQCKLGIVGAWGTVDEGYRGDIGIALYNHSDKPYHVSKGDRIAQLVITPVCRAKLQEVEDVGETDRGAAGFGSTGK